MSYKINSNIITVSKSVDLAYIKEYCYSATGKEITTPEAEKYLFLMPPKIINGIIQWDETDSVVRDNIFEWFQSNYK